MSRRLIAFLLCIAAMPCAAQIGSIRFMATGARPAADWATFLGAGYGLAAAVRTGVAEVAVGWTRFARTTVGRPWQGTTASITNGSSALALTVGPVLPLRLGPVGLDLTAAAGVAHVHTAARAVLPGDPALVDRSNTFDDLTWQVRTGADLRFRGPGPLDLVAGVYYARTGPIRIVREDLLVVGTISGLYIRPVPTPGTWLELRVGARVGL